jgi:hypothetical protein
MGLLQEHYLERDTLPAEHSGATIISPKEEGGIGFSIRAVQVGKQTHDGCIELSLGKLGLNPNSEIDKAVGGLKDFLRAENIPFELPPLLS